MNAKQLQELGQLLHGIEWRIPLAADLNVNERTIRRWAAGESPIPVGIMAESLRLITTRITKLRLLSERLL